MTRTIVLLLAFLMLSPLARAAPRSADLPSAYGGTQRIWYDAPANPWATVILFPGGDGVMGLDANGGINKLRGNFLVRTRQAWLRHGLAVIIPDVPAALSSLRDQRSSANYAADIAALVRYARENVAAPVWLVGTSNGAIAAAGGAARLTRGELGGIVLTSSVASQTRQGLQTETVLSVPLGRINVPALVTMHTDDSCPASPPSQAAHIHDAITAAPRKGMLRFSGGLPPRSGPCEAASAHGYLGIEPEVIGQIVSWMRQ
jgi:alpha-beta hydrolase superfamily lysophospholipase